MKFIAFYHSHYSVLMMELQKEIITKVVKGNEAFNEAMLKDPPQPWTHAQIMVYLFSLCAFLCSTSYPQSYTISYGDGYICREALANGR
jgi:hypothetical protein